MLSLALENKNVLVLTKDDASNGMGCFQKIKLDGGSIMAVMGSTSVRCTSARYQTLGFK
jgi:hypothetical protein